MFSLFIIIKMRSSIEHDFGITIGVNKSTINDNDMCDGGTFYLL